MKMAVGMLCVLALAGTVSVSGEKAEVTPVQKVIQLMEGMLEKGKKEKHEEEVQFAAFKQFCDDTQVEKKNAISDANEKIEHLKADIQKKTADAAQLTKEIAKLEEDISIWAGDMKAATEVRQAEKADYDKMHQDYSESIDALQRAIEVLKKQSHDRKQASFVQVANLKDLNLIPAEAKRTIDGFLQEAESATEELEEGAPEANAYEFQSSGVVEMLDKLLDKFMEERTTLEKEEMNTKHAFDMLMKDLQGSTDQATQDRDDKAEQKASTLQAKADAEGDLKDTIATRNADSKYLADLTAECEEKASAFESRQQLRAEEIEAIEKAIEIISSGAVSGNADKHLPASLLQQSAAFPQLRSDLYTQAQAQAAAYLSSRGKQLNSRVLSAIAARVSADPFAKVKKMIKDLIVKLLEEANEEAEAKSFCDTELSTNKQTRKEKTTAVETLHAEIDELEASIAKLRETITKLTEQVAELDAAMSKATELRNEEKAKNTETISDSQEAQTAVAEALTVLKDFYAKAAEATSFVQKPEIFDEPYKGMGSESGGVVGMLEVIESDFARLEADTKAAEETAQKEYDTFMTDSKVDKAKKTAEIEHKSAKLQDKEHALEGKKKDLDGNQRELDAALAYFDKLKPQCVNTQESYADRVAKREAEIESLRNALETLNNLDTR